MNKPKVRNWAGVFGLVSSIFLLATFPLYYPFVRAFVRRLRDVGKTSSGSLSLKDKIALYLNYELDKRLGGLGIGLYRLTSGRITQLWKVNVLILTTRGRKTGKTRTVLLQYFQDGANMVIVAANSGRASHPGWFYNLKATSTVRVQVMDRTFQIHAEELLSNEAIAFWPRILRVAPTYERYQRATNRTIPLVRLVPSEGGRESMKQQHNDYQVVPYSKIRRFMAAEFRSSHRTPMIHGLIEVDVSMARTFLRDQKAKTGKALSFTAFLIVCLAQAVEEHKAVQASRKGSKHLILFDEVDVLTYIERGSLPMPYIIRAANHKTVREIHHEIRTAQVQDVAQTAVGFKLVQYLPPFLFRFLLWMLGRDPQQMKKYVGTVALSSVGMFGDGAGWGIPPATPPSLWITVGGIGEKPGVVDGQIAIQDYLSLTISFDHDIIDGAPAARFTLRLKELIESGFGLDDSTFESEQAGAEVAAQKR